MALRAAEELLPDGMTLAIFDITPIPPYNEYVRQAGFSPPVEEFRDKIAATDALLIVTPEYNYSMPGVLKNAIDWASRPPDQPFDGKPVAIMGRARACLGRDGRSTPASRASLDEIKDMALKLKQEEKKLHKA